MSEQHDGHRLAAILAAGAAGNSSSGSLPPDLIEPTIARHAGRVAVGSSPILAEFASVTDALECAVELQRRAAAANSSDLAVAIHFGPVDSGSDGLHGDGATIATRLQQTAGPGAIAISQNARAARGGKLPFPTDDLGELALPGIATPVRAFKLRLAPEKTARGGLGWRLPALAAGVLVAIALGIYGYTERPWETRETPASPARMAYPLPERASVGVLAFANVSGDPAQDALSDSLAEDVAAELSKSNAAFVIARTATFAYKGKPVPLRQIAEELGIRYLVDGTVQRNGARFVATARVVDMLSGRTMWSKRFDHESLGFFEIGDEIALGAAEGMGVKLSARQRDIILQHETTSLDAWLLWRQAVQMPPPTKVEDVLAARDLLNKALEIDPKFVLATVALAHSFTTEGRGFLRGNSRTLYQRAEEIMDQAMALDDTKPEIWAEMASYRNARGDLEGSLQPSEKAVALDPNNWASLEMYGSALHRINRHADAVKYLRQAWRINPDISLATISMVGRAQMLAGQNDQAVATFETLIKRKPPADELFPVHAWLAVIYQERGNEAKAREQLALAKAIQPDLKISYFRRNYIYKDPATTLGRWITAWRALGVPE